MTYQVYITDVHVILFYTKDTAEPPRDEHQYRECFSISYCCSGGVVRDVRRAGGGGPGACHELGAHDDLPGGGTLPAQVTTNTHSGTIYIYT